MMKKKRVWFCLPASVGALILECLPCGAVLNFANPDGSPFRQTFSYFDMISFGYATFAPNITAWLTCTLLVLTVFLCVKGRAWLFVADLAVSFLAFLASLGPFLYGLSYVSPTGIAISAVLLLHLIFLLIFGRCNLTQT